MIHRANTWTLIATVCCLAGMQLHVTCVPAQAQSVLDNVEKREFEVMDDVDKGCQGNSDPRAIALQDRAMEIFWVKGKTKQAVDLFNRALKIDSSLVIPYDYLGLYYSMGKDRPERALAIFETGIARCPELPYLYTNYANVLANLGKHREAIAAIRRQVDLIERKRPLASGDATCFLNLGNGYARVGRYAEAVRSYQRCLQLECDYPKAWINLVLASRDAGDQNLAFAVASRIPCWTSDEELRENAVATATQMIEDDRFTRLDNTYVAELDDGQYYICFLENGGCALTKSSGKMSSDAIAEWRQRLASGTLDPLGEYRVSQGTITGTVRLDDGQIDLKGTLQVTEVVVDGLPGRSGAVTFEMYHDGCHF